MIEINDMVSVKVTEAQSYRASCRAQALGKLKNSITAGEGNFAAFLGEEVVKDFLGASYSHKDFYNHDLVFRNQKLEIKTKRRTVSPKLDYEVSVAKTSSHQKPDFYIFTSLNKSELTIIGFISHKDFFKKARLVTKGSIDNTNKFVCHTDMYNLKHSELFPINGLKNVFSY